MYGSDTPSIEFDGQQNNPLTQLDTSCCFKLPPYPYALVLFDRFSVFVGHDWNWFKRETFRRRLELTYKNPTAEELKDRIWLCQLLVVFALGESYNYESVPEIRLLGNEAMEDIARPNDQGRGRSAPNTDFFEQALALLDVRYENPSIEQVEALNLVVSSDSN